MVVGKQVFTPQFCRLRTERLVKEATEKLAEIDQFSFFLSLGGHRLEYQALFEHRRGIKESACPWFDAKLQREKIASLTSK